MVISAIGNITVLVTLIKRRLRTPSRLDVMLTHLAIADLMVSFFKYSFVYIINYLISIFSIIFSVCFESFYQSLKRKVCQKNQNSH